MVSCFCAIYSNSVDLLFLNTFISLLTSCLLTIILFFISTCLRIIGIKYKKFEKIYYFSFLLNPVYLMYGHKDNNKDEKNDKVIKEDNEINKK